WRSLTALILAALLAPVAALAAPEPGGDLAIAQKPPRVLASAQGGGLDGPPRLSLVRQPQYPLNGRFLMLNMHGALFHERASDFQENVAYARWLGAGVIRVFATDNNALKSWDGQRLGNHIADMAPIFRAGGLKLLVALVNNHRPVPGEVDESVGWMDGYYQLLLPFYTSHWRDAYLRFARDLIST